MAHETSDLDGEVRRVFASLARVPPFEERPQQLAMALEVARALEKGEHCIIEAPTGVGKSLAYLVPAALHAQRSGRSGFISTHTRNLQDQLLGRDLPLMRRALGPGLDAVLLKGRRNYLCPARLEAELAAPGLPDDIERNEQLSALGAWARTTRDGDLDRLGVALRPDLADMICSDPDLCGPASCGARCFHRRALERARRAHLVIVNHALYLALFGAGEEEADHAFLIADEAHALESVAGSGVKLSRAGMLRQLRRLYDPRTRSGLLGRFRSGGRTAFGRVLRETDLFWESVRRQAAARPGLTRSGHACVVRLRHPLGSLATLDSLFAELARPVERLAAKADDAQLARELEAALRQIEETRDRLRDAVACADPDTTYWVEYQERPRSPVALCAAPAEVGQTLRRSVFRPGMSVVLASASLAVGGDLSYFAGRIGAGPARSVVLDSPFEHRRQMRIALAPGAPEPDSAAYAGEIPAWILAAVLRSRGRALVLFTSAVALESAARALGPELDSHGIRLLVQGDGAGRDALLEEFRRDTGSVLFGLDSFWYGVDVPGEALEHVIIVRLPFPVPAHPAVEARMEAIQARGGNPFLEYMLPEAVLKLRQGAGRLIRSSADRGTVTILDSRILKKTYGRVLLGSLPRCPVELWSPGSDPVELDAGEW